MALELCQEHLNSFGLLVLSRLQSFGDCAVREFVGELSNNSSDANVHVGLEPARPGMLMWGVVEACKAITPDHETNRAQFLCHFVGRVDA